MVTVQRIFDPPTIGAGTAISIKDELAQILPSRYAAAAEAKRKDYLAEEPLACNQASISQFTQTRRSFWASCIVRYSSLVPREVVRVIRKCSKPEQQHASGHRDRDERFVGKYSWVNAADARH